MAFLLLNSILFSALRMPLNQVSPGGHIFLSVMEKLNSYTEWGKISQVGRGGGLVVSIFAFYSNHPSSNPAGDLHFLHKRRK